MKNKKEINLTSIIDEFNNHLAKLLTEHDSKICCIILCFDEKVLSDVTKKCNCSYEIVEALSEHYANIMELLSENFDEYGLTFERRAYEIKHNVFLKKLIEHYVLSATAIFSSYDK